MSNDEQDVAAIPHHLDADAVCEECGTVSPEDTLLCKKCGNNLRDQRMRRVSDTGAEPVPDERDRGLWVRVLLTIFGVLVIVWTLLNLGNIEEVLVAGFTAVESDATVNPELLWGPKDSAIYEELLRELDDNPIAQPDIERATRHRAARSGHDGRYVLQRETAVRRVVAGYANVRTVGDVTHFVARLGDHVEARGELENRGASSLETGIAAVRIGDEFIDLFGTALRGQNGAYNLLGLVGPQDDTYTGLAYFVP